jgi:DNA-binding transcriptional MerR regulator
MRLTIGAAARALGSTPRMLRYREALGLLAPAGRTGGRRWFGERELTAAAYAADLEARYDISPKALAFALRVLSEPGVEVEVRRLGMLARRLTPPAPIAVLDYEAEKARRLLLNREAEP